ncbi:MAG: exo-alpha-sialidase, partial [Lentisphaerae bacterium]|nr:exo-alpha-sialidase [Lentisphaerota bacterium]
MSEDPLVAVETVTDIQDQHRTAARQFQGIPGIERTAGGRLWATWYTGGVNEGPQNFAVLVTSTDDGLTWT